MTDRTIKLGSIVRAKPKGGKPFDGRLISYVDSYKYGEYAVVQHLQAEQTARCALDEIEDLS
jgi:hypothetical protein